MTKPSKKKPGPEAEHLHLPGDWKDNVAKALKRGPYSGPTPNKPKKKKRRAS